MKKFIASFSLIVIVFGIFGNSGITLAANKPTPKASVKTDKTQPKSDTKVEKAQTGTGTNAEVETKTTNFNWLLNVLVAGNAAKTQPAQAPKSTMTAMTNSLGINDPPPPPQVQDDPLKFLKGLQGNYQTDLFSGAATYSIPFWIPNGRLNTQPTLSLNYSSNNRKLDSIAGYGWNLSSSSIYRSTPKGMNNLYTQNSFSMELFGNSRDLISVDSANGKYASKVEGSFDDFTFQNNAWVMKDTQGNQYFFGSTNGSRQTDPNDSTHTYKWMLEKVQDTNGNTINFTYFSDANQVYPNTIRYSGHDTDLGLYEIQFARTPNLYPLTSYTTGFQVKTNYLIDHIDILAHTNTTPPLVRRYQFAYTYGQNALPKLTQVTTVNGAKQFPPLKFFYFDGTQTVPGSLNLLREIQFPAGGIQDITYQQSTAYRTSTGGISNSNLPFQINTVHTSALKVSSSDPAATYTYDYSGGHYYFDSLDAYKKEYSGFHIVTVKDPLNNLRTIFFHQSEFSIDNAQSVLQGEYDDHISKKGKIYREEVRNSTGNLYQTIIRKWDKRTEPDDDPSNNRWFPFLARETTITYDGNASARATSIEKTYDDFGNITQVVDYGEVQTTSNNGDFTDIGTDKQTTTIQYAQNATAHIYATPQIEQLKDSTNTMIGENRKYYDQLALGQVNLGNLTKVEKRITNQPTYQTSQTQYNSYGLPVTVTNPRQYQTTIAYDSYNLFPQTITNAKNQETNYTYNYLYGVVNEATDPNGSKNITTLDELGRVVETRKTDPHNPTQDLALANITYNTASYPNSVTSIIHTQNQNIDAESDTYIDGFSRPIQTKSESEGTNKFTVTSKTYDLLGNVQKDYLPKTTTGNSYESPVVTDPGTTYTYDVMGRVLTATNTLGTSTNSYDDWTTTSTDADAKRKDYTNDARRNLVQVKEYIGSTPYTTSYVYDGLKNLIKVTDANGNIRNFTYDLLGRKLTQEDLHTSNDTTFGTWTYGYDDNNNLTSQTDPKNQTINYTYDEIDRPLTEDYTGQTGTEVTNTYDQGTNGIGRLTSVSTPDIQKSYTYDALGRQTQEQKTINSQNYITSFDYDLVGNQLSVIYPGSMAITYSYNNAAQLAIITKNGTTTVVNNIDYAPTGTISQLDSGNGVSTQNTYDSQKLFRLTHKLTTKGTTKLQDTSYQFDPVGNITNITDASNTDYAKTANYGYDDLHRLTSATITNTANSQDYTQTYSYDILGNILTRSDIGSYTYAGGDSGTSNGTTANPDAATTVNSATYTYDANGNVTSDGVWTYTYDYKDRIASATNGTDTYTYNYDESGNRIKKTNTGTSKITVYVNKYYDVEDSNAKRYIYANDLKVADDSDADGLTYHSTDDLTGTNVDTDSLGNILEVLDYYPYGNVRFDEQTGTYQNDYKYTGKELDEGTNLYYYGARYYNAQIGRFMSLDPLFLDQATRSGQKLKNVLNNPQQLNGYSYAANNPLKITDPTGEFILPISVDPTYSKFNFGSSTIYDNGSTNPQNNSEIHYGQLFSNGLPPLSPVERTSIIILGSLASGTGVYSKGSEIIESVSSAIESAAANKQVENSGPKPAKNFIEPTNPPQEPSIPDNYTNLGPTRNGNGTVYGPPGTPQNTNANTIQVYEPTDQYQNGYWKEYNGNGEPINPSTGKPADGREDYHIPRPPKS